MSAVSVAMRRFLKQDSGLETVEYAVMTAIIVSALVVALSALVLAIVDVYASVSDIL